MKIAPRCPGLEEHGISGIGPFDHSWVDGPVYIAPNLDDGQPARWTDLVCESCGVVSSGWERLAGPA